MAQDIGEKLKSILSDPKMMESFSGLLDSGEGKNSTNNNENDTGGELQSLMSKLGTGDDKRINLLNALRPYMKSSRAESIDKAVRIIKLTKLSSILKDL